MNERSDINRVLSHWFDDGPTTMPDRVVEVVADRIGRQPQRRSWRLRGRPYMNGYLKVVVGLAAAAIIAVAGWQLLPGRGGIGGEPTPVPTPTGVAASVSPSCEDDIPGCAGELSAGDHQSAHFSPGFAFATQAGWSNPVDTSGLYTLWPEDSLLSVAADLIMVWSNVVPAEMTGSCQLIAKPGATATPDGWIAYLTSYPAVIASNVRSIDVNGSTGKVADLALNPSWTPACADDVARRAAPFVTTPGGGGIADGYGIAQGVGVRLYAIQLGNQTVVITVHVYDFPTAGAYAATTELAQRVIDTFSWACKADSPPGPCWGPPDASGNPATPPAS